tara:strand:+ start:53 stop:1342 length:1290 start_codon:yes stop_codon:yes gene_type:complete
MLKINILLIFIIVIFIFVLNCNYIEGYDKYYDNILKKIELGNFKSNNIQGATSKSFIINGLFIKYVNNYIKYGVYEREKFISTILNKFDWYPKLLHYNDDKKVLIFENVGVPINLKNLPNDFKKQFNKILLDMKSVNIQHNDIKQEELLIDKNNKIYLCDFGWASVNNDTGCGIDIWSSNNKNKHGPWYDDQKFLERLHIYTDPIRKIGSQSETPSIKYDGDFLKVSGYQVFTINKNTKIIEFDKKKYKFSYINNLLSNLNIDNCKSFVDIGCNSGLTSLIAFNNGFDYIVSLDHDPEYIQTLSKIKEYCKITNIHESVFSFGDPITEKFDVVFCGAIIHWIFSLTANFKNFISIIQYLIQITNKYLVIEWVDQNDSAILSLNHIKKNKQIGDEEYNTKNFETAVKKYTKIISKKDVENTTRTIYLLEK